MLDNYLFIRIPIVKPAAFLERTIDKVAPLWSYPALTFFALLALTGLFLVSRQWDSFLASFLYFFSWQGLIAYGLGLFVIKILHELGHAYTATRFGCRVPEHGGQLFGDDAGPLYRYIRCMAADLAQAEVDDRLRRCHG